MPIVPSRSKQIQELIAALAAPHAAERDSAVARLTLVGERAVAPLAAAARSGPAAGRPHAAEALSRLAAAGSAAARAALHAILSDPKTEADVRAVAMDAAGGRDVLDEADALLASLPEGPEAIPALHAALGRLPPAGSQPRAARIGLRLHQALAARGSRIALYDLRERLEARPARDAEGLLEVAASLGDASFIPTLARLASDALPLVPACADTLRAIVAREKIKKGQRSVKAVRPEHRATFESLWTRARR